MPPLISDIIAYPFGADAALLLKAEGRMGADTSITARHCALESLCDSTTNDIRFVLLCPETTEVGTSNQSDGNACYDRFDLRTKYDGHRWTIDSKSKSTAGTESLWLSDQTANLVTNLNLGLSRFWRLSDEGIWIPLEKIDFATNRRVLGDSEAGFKRTVSLRKGM